MFAYDMYTDLHERDVLWFIFARTCMYGKVWETIPLRHFTHGVFSEGVCHGCPVRMGEAKLLESLKHLEAKRVIQVVRHPTRASRYKVSDTDEFDTGHALAYMRRYQKKAFRGIWGKIAARWPLPELAEKQQQVFVEQSQATKAMIQSRYPSFPTPIGNGSPQVEGTVPHAYGEHNKQNVNKRIIKLAASPLRR